MKQILIQLDDWLAAELERVAPGKSHKRSAFIRAAITRAIHEEAERATREAYGRWPDEATPFDPADWAPEADAFHPDETTSPSRPRRSKPAVANPSKRAPKARARAAARTS